MALTEFRSRSAKGVTQLEVVDWIPRLLDQFDDGARVLPVVGRDRGVKR